MNVSNVNDYNLHCILHMNLDSGSLLLILFHTISTGFYVRIDILRLSVFSEVHFKTIKNNSI